MLIRFYETISLDDKNIDKWQENFYYSEHINNAWDNHYYPHTL